MDLRPFRHPRFRILWSGSLLSIFASQMTIVLVAKHVYDLTGSSLAVGLVAAAELIPLMLLALVGGAIADAFDRRAPAGNVEAGAVAAVTTTTVSVLTGALACIIGAGVLAALLPGFVRYDARQRSLVP
jgi:MFS family permease